MGNSTSAQGDEDSPDKVLLPDVLFHLNDNQCSLLWQAQPLAYQEVTQAARSIGAFSKEAGNNSLSLSGLYQQEEESPEAALAVRLCQLLPELAALRFKLVPSKLREDKIWQATLMLLKERLVEYNFALRYGGEILEGSESTGHVVVVAAAEEQTLVNGGSKSQKGKKESAVNGESNNNNGGNDTIIQLRFKNAQIANLQLQVRDLQAKLDAATSNMKSENKSSDNHDKNNNNKHQGSWKVDKDSKEFLEYPSEIKENLRKEKQRRVRQVLNEMKFILDSDDLKDTNGKWDCCGETKYHASCSM